MQIFKGFLISLSVLVILLLTVSLLEHYNFYTFVLPILGIAIGALLYKFRTIKKFVIGFLLALALIYAYIISVVLVLGSMGC